MRFNRRLVKKLASLSAIGAGAMALGGKKAQASIIYSGPLDQTVGFSAGSVPDFTASFPANFTFKTGTFRSVYGENRSHNIKFHGTSEHFKTNSGVLQPFNAGVVWSGPTNSGRTHGTVAKRLFLTFYPFANRLVGSPFTDQYALFTFPNGGHTDYGWVELSLAMTLAPGVSGGGTGPDLTIQGWAYDNSGLLIAAGELPSPEPGTLALSALVLGAVGLRRWRAARKA